jgi:hypothetical protein
MRLLLCGLTAVLVVAAASSALAGAPGNEKGERSLAKMLEGRTAGQSIDCIDPARAFSSEIINGTAVVYRMPGGKIYVNRPRVGAEFLDQDNMIHTRTFGARLCSYDMVTLVDRGGRLGLLPAAFVSMGPFVPYDKVQP